jgi:hypothetical protein
MFTELNQYHVVMEVDPKFQYGPEALNGIYVKSSSGQRVPLSTLVDDAVKVAPLVVNHQGQLPSVTISYNLTLMRCPESDPPQAAVTSGCSTRPCGPPPWVSDTCRRGTHRPPPRRSG